VTKQRFLVSHDYGMGGLWWWIHARSPREVLETFAEVEVVDPAKAGRSESWELEEVDIDAATMPAGLDGLRAKRAGQRALPGFGALADRQVVYLREVDDSDGPVTYLTEVGSDGRRIRQVSVAEDGTATKSDAESWLFNPPLVDLFDPRLPEQEIDRAEFEQAWADAEWEADR
jgi:hypothetical protein